MQIYLTSGITPAFTTGSRARENGGNFDFAKPRVSSSFARTGSSSEQIEALEESFKRDKEESWEAEGAEGESSVWLRLSFSICFTIIELGYQESCMTASNAFVALASL